jgi:hypothetical protein
MSNGIGAMPSPDAAPSKPRDYLLSPDYNAKHRRRGKKPDRAVMARKRLREIESIIRHRHGFVPDTDDAEQYVYLAAQHLYEQAGDKLHESLTLWCDRWTPHFPPVEIERIARRVIADPRRFKADTLGKLLALTDEERTNLKITTIGAKDLSKARRATRRATKKRERDRKTAEARRRARGAIPREQYLASALTATRPWEADNVKRRTWERRRAKAAASASPVS